MTPKPPAKAVASPPSLSCVGLVLLVEPPAVQDRDPSAPVPVVPVPTMPLSPAFMPPPMGLAPLEPWLFSDGSASPSAKVEAAAPLTIVEPTRITVQRWGCLEDGALLAKSRTIDGSTSMRRTGAIHVKKCPRCGGHLRALATITDPDVIKKILDHLHVRSSPLARAPARDPMWDQQSFRYERDAA